MPQPSSDHEALPWWEACAEHRLTVQRCTECSHTRLPPSPICPECRSDASDWKLLSGKGSLYSYTVVHRPIALDQEVPYVIAVIALEGGDGVRMISNIVDTPHADLAIDLPVEIVWEDMGPDLSMPRFRAVKE